MAIVPVNAATDFVDTPAIVRIGTIIGQATLATNLAKPILMRHPALGTTYFTGASSFLFAFAVMAPV